jgi:hypothetical protein
MSKPFEPPERIWLQTHDDHGDLNDPLDGTVTWCADRQNETDVEYVRADELERYRAALTNPNQPTGPERTVQGISDDLRKLPWAKEGR